MNSITLSQLTQHIERAITANFEKAVWIRAEISEFSVRNGHAYFEFVEKEKQSDKIIAKSRGTCWASVFGMLKPYFETTAKETLRAGLEVMVAVSVKYSQIYGLSLNVCDIDPHFTIGRLASRRDEIIRQIKEDGIAEMNKELSFPLLPKRLAIISSPKAAGYEDFCHQLEKNRYGFQFYKKLFPAIVQGEKAEQSIISALEKIYNYSHLFDVVLILRGGGAVTDLACFDSYDLAINCAQFPLPILAGIGHQKDISVVDMVAHKSLKTPTAVAEFMIDRMLENSEKVQSLSSRVSQLVENNLQEQDHRLSFLQNKLIATAQKKISEQRFVEETLVNRIKYSVSHYFERQKSKLSLIGYKIENNSPLKILEKGMSITYVNNKKLTSIKEIQKGDVIKTYLKDGSFESVVK